MIVNVNYKLLLEIVETRFALGADDYTMRHVAANCFQLIYDENNTTTYFLYPTSNEYATLIEMQSVAGGSILTGWYVIEHLLRRLGFKVTELDDGQNYQKYPPAISVTVIN